MKPEVYMNYILFSFSDNKPDRSLFLSQLELPIFFYFLNARVDGEYFQESFFKNGNVILYNVSKLLVWTVSGLLTG